MKKKALEERICEGNGQWKDDALKIAVYPSGCGREAPFDYERVNPKGAIEIRKNSLRYMTIAGGTGIAIDLDFDYDDNEGQRRYRRRVVEWHNVAFIIFKDYKGVCGGNDD